MVVDITHVTTKVLIEISHIEVHVHLGEQFMTAFHDCVLRKMQTGHVQSPLRPVLECLQVQHTLVFRLNMIEIPENRKVVPRK